MQMFSHNRYRTLIVLKQYFYAKYVDFLCVCNLSFTRSVSHRCDLFDIQEQSFAHRKFYKVQDIYIDYSNISYKNSFNLNALRCKLKEYFCVKLQTFFLLSVILPVYLFVRLSNYLRLMSLSFFVIYFTPMDSLSFYFRYLYLICLHSMVLKYIIFWSPTAQ